MVLFCRIMEEVVHEGYLVKSPPEKRILKAKWRQRWFVLRHSGLLPGQYILEYFTDNTCRKAKGKIDLDQCVQVEVAVTFESKKTSYQYMFDIITPKRVYNLVAETEEDMNKWVDCICSVLGLKLYIDEEYNTPQEVSANAAAIVNPIIAALPPSLPSATTVTRSISNPYIPISECHTGKPILNNNDPNNEPRTVLTTPVSAPTPNEQPSEPNFPSEFYDYPRPLGSINSGLCDAPKNDINFNIPNGCSTLPPRVNWKTYPSEVSPKNFSTIPRKESVEKTDSGYDIPLLHCGSHKSEAIRRDVEDLNNTFEKAIVVESGSNVASAVSGAKDQKGASTFVPPPRPPKPPKYRDRHDYENFEPMHLKSSKSDLSYDVPLSIKGPTTAYDIPPPVKGLTAGYDIPLLVKGPTASYDISVPIKGPTIGYDIPPPIKGPTACYDVPPPIKGPTASYDVPPPIKGITAMKVAPNPLITIYKKEGGGDLSPSMKVPLSSAGGESVMDDTYDFPKFRSEDNININAVIPHPQGTGTSQRQRRHAYTNAPPGLFNNKELIFNYEYRPSLMTSDYVNMDSGKQELYAASPESTQSSSLGAYANVPASPSVISNHSQNDTPPAIDRGLKPRRTSDQGSFGFLTLQPPPLFRSKASKRSFRKLGDKFLGQSMSNFGIPSASNSGVHSGLNGTPPVPNRLRHHPDMSAASEDDLSSSGGSRRNSSNDDQARYFAYVPSKKEKDEIQYLDLDLESEPSPSPKSPERMSTTVYKKVDFVKTKAFNETRQNVEETYRKSQ